MPKMLKAKKDPIKAPPLRAPGRLWRNFQQPRIQRAAGDSL